MSDLRSALPRLGLSTVGLDLRRTAALAARADRLGVGAVWTSESSIIHGVGRTPLVLAVDTLAVDELCQGRLLLGLGNGTRRMLDDWFGVSSEAPAIRMEELVVLLRRLWRLHEGPVRHEGRFYHLDLVPTGDLTPPLRTEIPIFIGGVNPRMIEVAGRVGDGLVGHPLFGTRYLEDVVHPSITTGARLRDRDAHAVAVAGMVICCVDADEDRARHEAAAQIALYASVKTYERPLQVAGFARQAVAIREAFARRDLSAMTAAVTDDMIDALALTGRQDQVMSGLRRYDGLLDHIVLYAPSIGLDIDRIEESIAALAEAIGSERPIDGVALKE
jgi:alkanesulfonate monooxygenase SsuD/methylene tetrahydromethanopterin reductase-like flavin-dependent oxidoreductase (luciferase family)